MHVINELFIYLLAGAVVTSSQPPTSTEDDSEEPKEKIPKRSCPDSPEKEVKEEEEEDEEPKRPWTIGALTCIGVLPGMGPYGDSSATDSSDESTDVEGDAIRFDLLGRKIRRKSRRLKR